jgi:hypothetical protein
LESGEDLSKQVKHEIKVYRKDYLANQQVISEEGSNFKDDKSDFSTNLNAIAKQPPAV